MELTDADPKFWAPIKEIRDSLNTQFTGFPVLEIGPEQVPLECATHFIDFSEEKKEHPNVVSIDIDVDPFPYSDHQFKCVYARHVLEDIQNPDAAFKEMTRVAEYGFVETPSPLIECSLGAENSDYRGYIHHRYIVWTETETHTLCFLPKYPILDQLSFGNVTTDAVKHPFFWNNYYEWSPDLPPRIRMYKNGVNFNILTEYTTLINTALKASFQHTRHMFDPSCRP